MDWLTALFFAVWWIVPVALAVYVGSKIFGVQKKPTEELKALFGQPGQWISWVPACAELKKRGEDFTVAFPALLDLSLSGNAIQALVGMKGLRGCFGEQLKHLNLVTFPMSGETRDQVMKLRDELRARMGNG